MTNNHTNTNVTVIPSGFSERKKKSTNFNNVISSRSENAINICNPLLYECSL